MLHRALPALLVLAVAAAATWPFPVSPGAHDHADTLFNTWLVSWNSHALLNLRNPLQPPVFLGQEDAVGRNDLLLTQALPALPMRALGVPPLRVHNTLFFLSLAFAGYAAYLLALDQGVPRPGAVFSGVAFTSLPFFQAHMWHLQLMSAGLAVLAVRQALGFLRGERRLWPLSLLVLLQGLASLYYLVFLDLALVLVALPRLFTGPRRRIPALAAAAAAGNAAMLPFLAEHIRNAASYGMDSVVSTDLAALHSPWEGDLLAPLLRPGWLSGETALWPGLAVLAGLALLVLGRRRSVRLRDPLPLLLLGIFFLPFCLGPTVSAWGLELSPGPYRLLGLLPGMGSVRLPARAGFLYLLPLVLAAGAGIGRRRLAAAGLGALMLAELLPLGHSMMGTEPDPWHFWIEEREPAAVAFLPLSTDLTRPEKECKRLYGQILHWTPMVNGYSTSLPDGYGELARLLSEWPSPEADSALAALGVDCVVLRDSSLPGADTVWTSGPRSTSGVMLDRDSYIGRHGQETL